MIPGMMDKKNALFINSLVCLLSFIAILSDIEGMATVAIAPDRKLVIVKRGII